MNAHKLMWLQICVCGMLIPFMAVNAINGQVIWLGVDVILFAANAAMAVGNFRRRRL